MNWEKILQLDANGLYKNINLFFYGFLFYCLITIANSYGKPNEIGVPINFKINTPIQGVWKISTNEAYNVKISEYGQTNLYIDAKSYSKELIISKLSDLLPLLIFGFIFLQIRGLSKSIVEKKPFEKTNISRLRKIGFGIILFWFIDIVLFRYLALLARDHITISDLEVITTRSFTHLSYAILGLVFLLIAHVFKKGIELREENALTI